MHSDLIDFFKNNGFYTVSKIKDLENSPCTANDSTVIDFLDAKEKFYHLRLPQKSTPKSVSGLYVSRDGELLFIHTVTRDKADAIEVFLKKFSAHKLNNKLEGSVETLNDMVGYFGWYTEFKNYLEKNAYPRVKTILLINLSIADFLTLRLTFGDELNIGTNNPVTDDIIIMTCEEFYNKYC